MRAPTRGARAAGTAPTRDWLMTIDGPPDWAITMFVKSVFFMGDSIAQRGIGRVALVATCWSCMYALLARYVRPLSAWRAKYPRRPRRGTSERSRDLPQGRRAGGSRLSRPFSADRCLTDFRRL